MLWRRCYNSQKSKNTQTSEVNSKFFFSKICWKHDTPLQFLSIHYSRAFTVPLYRFLFSRYLDLTECHFLADIFVPFPDSSNWYSHEIGKETGIIKGLGFVILRMANSYILKQEVMVKQNLNENLRL